MWRGTSQGLFPVGGVSLLSDLVVSALANGGGCQILCYLALKRMTKSLAEDMGLVAVELLTANREVGLQDILECDVRHN